MDQNLPGSINQALPVQLLPPIAIISCPNEFAMRPKMQISLPFSLLLPEKLEWEREIGRGNRRRSGPRKRCQVPLLTLQPSKKKERRRENDGSTTRASFRIFLVGRSFGDFLFESSGEKNSFSSLTQLFLFPPPSSYPSLTLSFRGGNRREQKSLVIRDSDLWDIYWNLFPRIIIRQLTKADFSRRRMLFRRKNPWRQRNTGYRYLSDGGLNRTETAVITMYSEKLFFIRTCIYIGETLKSSLDQ